MLILKSLHLINLHFRIYLAIPGVEGGWWGNSLIKTLIYLVLVGNCEKRYQDPVLWLWCEFFSPLRAGF